MSKLENNQLQLFLTWVNKIITSNFTNESLDKVVQMIEDSAPEEVEHVISNFANNLRRMQEVALEKGKNEGRNEGEAKKQKEIAENLLNKGLTHQLLQKLLGFLLKMWKRFRMN